MELVKERQVTVGNENLLCAGCCHGTLAVGGESEVAGCEHSRLRILNVHVVNARQVTHTSRDGHITLVLHSSCLSTHLHAGISVLRVGVERHKQDLHAVLSHDARQLGELYVITNKDAYLSTVGVEGLHTVALAQAPALLLVGCDMNFLVHVVRAIATAEESHVVQSAIFLHIRHGACYDVDVVADSQLHEAVTDLLGILRQSADRLRLTHVVKLGHEWRVEIFGEEHKVALIVAHRVDKKLHLLKQVVHIFIRTHLPLH